METITQLPCSSTGVTDPATATRTCHRFALVGIPLLTVFLRLFRLEQEGYADLYYAAAVKSMLLNWDIFLLNFFDPGVLYYRTLTEP